MSLEIVRRVHAQHPELLAENTGRTCHQFTQYVVEHLRAADHLAFLMCKTQGEGQYVPFGFVPRDVIGLDGKTYRCTGVSHDAIWSDGKQFDAIISANNGDHPLIQNGRRVHASPTWHEIPEHLWRPQNPPLRERNTTIQPPAPIRLPDRGEMMHAGAWLDAFYASPEGLQRSQGLSINGRPDWEGVGAWLFDVYLNARLAGKTDAEARAAVVRAIQDTDEWKSKHPA